MFYAHLFLAVLMLVCFIVNFCEQEWLMATVSLICCISNINQL